MIEHDWGDHRSIFGKGQEITSGIREMLRMRDCDWLVYYQRPVP
jgi:hypothetical protein